MVESISVGSVVFGTFVGCLKGWVSGWVGGCAFSTCLVLGEGGWGRNVLGFGW